MTRRKTATSAIGALPLQKCPELSQILYLETHQKSLCTHSESELSTDL